MARVSPIYWAEVLNWADKLFCKEELVLPKRADISSPTLRSDLEIALAQLLGASIAEFKVTWHRKTRNAHHYSIKVK
jgi:hypothetical protein